MFGPSPSRGHYFAFSFAAAVIVAASGLGTPQRGLAAEPQKIELSSSLPYGPAPINYFSETEPDLIKDLQTRLNDGKLILKAKPDSGYLIDLLQALQVPVESQTLVFSKTSVNQALVKPSNPRAIYFNDDVTVGWVPGAAALEITLQDPVKGTLFYTLPQPVEAPTPDSAEPTPLRFHRDGRCIACHVSARTLSVPGHIISSYLTDTSGQPREGSSSINHATEFKNRWGGWYVTGRTPDLNHWGNLVGDADARQHKLDPAFRGAVEDLTSLVDLTRYPTQHSDAVALLVLNHQMHFYNLVNRVSFEYRLNRRSDAEDHLIRYAVMQDEAPLPGPVTGSTKFADVYQSVGSVDPVRKLRQLDLTSRLFQHDLSPLIGSRSFQSLPDEVKERVSERMDAELSERPDQTARSLFHAIWKK